MTELNNEQLAARIALLEARLAAAEARMTSQRSDIEVRPSAPISRRNLLRSAGLVGASVTAAIASHLALRPEQAMAAPSVVPGQMKLTREFTPSFGPTPHSTLTFTSDSIMPSSVSAGSSWLIVNPYTTTCEIRRITTIVDTNTRTITVAPALENTHSSDTVCMWTDRPVYSVALFGAKGKGNATPPINDGPAIQAAIDAAVAEAAQGETGAEVVFEEGIYGTRQEIKVPKNDRGLRLVGRGHGFAPLSTIKALAAMPSVVAVMGQNTFVSGIKVDGGAIYDDEEQLTNRNATYAWYLSNAGRSIFERCSATNAKLDGVFVADIAGTNNNQIVWNDCTFQDNGILYGSDIIINPDHPDAPKPPAGYTGDILSEYIVPLQKPADGTVSTSDSTEDSSEYNIEFPNLKQNQVVTGSGTKFTKLGIRPGDVIRIGRRRNPYPPADPTDEPDTYVPEYLQIVRVMSDEKLIVGVRHPSERTVSAQPYVIGVGDGYHEERFADNNNAMISGGMSRKNAGIGLAFTGLYGPTVINTQSDFNGSYGLAVGRFDNNSMVHTTALIKPYFEGNKISMLLGMCNGIDITMPLFGDKIDYHVGLNIQMFGTMRAPSYLDKRPVLEQALGAGASEVPLAKLVRTFNAPYEILSEGTTIPITASHVRLSSNDDVVMTAVPTIDDGIDGQVIRLFNMSPTSSTITLEDHDTLPGSNLRLTSSQIVLAPLQSVELTFVAWKGLWIQTSPVVAVLS
jgi:hypothetical protein